FISGYATITHKHIDDLSFTLFYKGKDFFVDPGKYSYSKHPYRRYVKSFKGHSGIYINNTNYKITDKNRLVKKVYLNHHFENVNFTLVKGTNESYAEGALSRTILYIKEFQMTIIIDEIKANEDISVLHNFNFHHKVETIKLNEYSYKLINCDVDLKIVNHNNKSFEKVYGNKSKEPYTAINSVVFNEVIETTQLQNTENLISEETSINIYSIADSDMDLPLEILYENALLK